MKGSIKDYGGPSAPCILTDDSLAYLLDGSHPGSRNLFITGDVFTYQWACGTEAPICVVLTAVPGCFHHSR